MFAMLARLFQFFQRDTFETRFMASPFVTILLEDKSQFSAYAAIVKTLFSDLREDSPNFNFTVCSYAFSAFFHWMYFKYRQDGKTESAERLKPILMEWHDHDPAEPDVRKRLLLRTKLLFEQVQATNELGLFENFRTMLLVEKDSPFQVRGRTPSLSDLGFDRDCWHPH